MEDDAKTNIGPCSFLSLSLADLFFFSHFVVVAAPSSFPCSIYLYGASVGQRYSLFAIFFFSLFDRRQLAVDFLMSRSGRKLL